MGLRRRPWTIGLPLTTGLLTLALIGGQPSAQAPLSSGPIAGEATLYEASPKLRPDPLGMAPRPWIAASSQPVRPSTTVLLAGNTLDQLAIL